MAALCHAVGPGPKAATFGAWSRRRGVQQRFGAIGKYGSLAVVERFIRSLENECTRAILAFLLVTSVLSSGIRDLGFRAVALVASGVAGNMLDRVRFGFVRDYFLVGLGRIPTAVFNVADVAIEIGGGLLLVHVLRGRR